MKLVEKFLWVDKETHELVVKQYSAMHRAVSFFSADELRRKGGEAFLARVTPVLSTAMVLPEDDEPAILPKGE